MSEYPPVQLRARRTDDPVQSHDQILQANTGKPVHLHCVLATCAQFVVPPIKARYVLHQWSSAQNSRYPADSNELAGTNQPRQATIAGQPHLNQQRPKNDAPKENVLCRYWGTNAGNYKHFIFTIFRPRPKQNWNALFVALGPRYLTGLSRS